MPATSSITCHEAHDVLLSSWPQETAKAQAAVTKGALRVGDGVQSTAASAVLMHCTADATRDVTQKVTCVFVAVWLQESQRKVALLEAMVKALRERLSSEETRTKALSGGGDTAETHRCARTHTPRETPSDSSTHPGLWGRVGALYIRKTEESDVDAGWQGVRVVPVPQPRWWRVRRLWGRPM